MAEEEVKKICCRSCPYSMSEVKDEIGGVGINRAEVLTCRRFPLNPSWYRVPRPEQDCCGEHPDKKAEIEKIHLENQHAEISNCKSCGHNVESLAHERQCGMDSRVQVDGPTEGDEGSP